MCRIQISTLHTLCGCTINTTARETCTCKLPRFRLSAVPTSCTICGPLIPTLSPSQRRTFTRRLDREKALYVARLKPYTHLLNQASTSTSKTKNQKKGHLLTSIPLNKKLETYLRDRSIYYRPRILFIPAGDILPDKDTCGICMSSMRYTIVEHVLEPEEGCDGGGGGSVSMLPCGHFFGRYCIAEMLSYPGLERCPICKRGLEVRRMRRRGEVDGDGEVVGSVLGPADTPPPPPPPPPPVVVVRAVLPPVNAVRPLVNVVVVPPPVAEEEQRPLTRPERILIWMFVLLALYSTDFSLPLPFLGWTTLWPIMIFVVMFGNLLEGSLVLILLFLVLLTFDAMEQFLKTLLA